MRNAYKRARFGEAARTFDAHSKSAPLDAVLLRARILLKQDEPAGVIRLLAATGPSSTDDRGEVLMLLASAHARMRQFSEADEEFAAAERCAKDADDKDLLAQIAYRKAVRYVHEYRSADARKEIALAKNAPSRQTRINAAEAESFLLACESRYEEQASVLVNLLQTLDPNNDEFLESRAWAAHTLAILARELYVPEAAIMAERHLESDHWPPDFAVNRFQGFKAIGWTHALRGDYFTGFRYLKRSLLLAPGKEWLGIAHADRAYLAKCNCEPTWAQQETLEAEECIKDVDWQSMRGEEPIALLLIAELFADTDASRAAYYLARFDELGGVGNRLLHFPNDARLRALADYSRARVELSLHNDERAVSLLRSTEQFFTGIGYQWRAGRCALDLHEVTKDTTHLKRATGLLQNYMHSWLGARLHISAGQSFMDVRLPKMEQKVFQAICSGLSNAGIAKQLTRSERAVAEHVELLLRTFNVPSRSALVAEAVRRGLALKQE